MTTGQPWDACMTTGFGLSSASGGHEPTPAAHARTVEALVRELDLPKFTIVAHFPREHCSETIVRIMQRWLQRRIPGGRTDPWWSRHTADLDLPARASQ